MANNAATPEVAGADSKLSPGDGSPSRVARKSGKGRGWVYLRSASDACALINRIINLTLVGDTKQVADPAKAPKLDATTANALFNGVKCWLAAHDQVLERRVLQLEDDMNRLLEYLDKRGIDPAPVGRS